MGQSVGAGVEMRCEEGFGLAQFWEEPCVLRIKPHIVVAPFTPRGGEGLTGLEPVDGSERVEMIRRGLESRAFETLGELAYELIEELRAFVPPMTQQLGVVRADQDGCGGGRFFGDETEVSLPRADEVRGVEFGLTPGCFGVVECLRLASARDLVVFEPGETALLWARKKRFDVIHVGLESEVGMEISVNWISWVATFAAPDLVCREHVAKENHEPGIRLDGLFGGVGERKLVRDSTVTIEDDPFDSGIAEDGTERGVVSALGQPEAPRRTTEVVLVMTDSGADLGFDTACIGRDEREDCVRG